ncbi:dihydropteroate synthase-related protein [Sulfolobus islandicus L.S.2.15]|uniref:Dihydropteroate synthase-related protein n=1 Tax=Saccharolobus islandicus (strain L.S.2.15 / Lassen \|nr:dihydropteroate synthase-like protein [Sulfolobus islandicus]ACP34392.1 dihydropteroate synthase-related protein [Sulfolobus islandicus L.S.2.15]
MKVLVVTGTLAAPILSEVAKNIKDTKVEIKVLNYPVASLMSTKFIAENLKQTKYDVDYILLPGMVYGDAKIVEEVTGVKTFKGTEEAWDLPRVIEALKNGVQLSTTEPADKIIGKMDNIEEKLRKIEEEAKISFEINGVKITNYPPPFRIFLEIDNKQEFEKLERLRRNINVVVLGLPVGHYDLDEVKNKVRQLVDYGHVVGIDAESPRELKEGVRAGASFVFNLNETNLEELEEIRREAAFVVAPFNTENRGEITVDLVRKAKQKGFDKLIADPVLSPPLRGLVNSIIEYKYVREKLQDIPILMGILNVTELIDADSLGVNALLSAIAGELGISNLLIMEKGKTKWSSWELSQATKMISIALKENRLPKDIGIDLLVLKDKRIFRENFGADVIVNEYIEPEMDKSGFAKIFVSEDGFGVKWIGKNKVTIKGKNGLSIGRELIRRVKDISKEHAVYIGYELAKAEIAYQLDKNYIQDKPLFKKIINDNFHTEHDKKRDR